MKDEQKDEFDVGNLDLPESSEASSSPRSPKFKAKRQWGKITKKALLIIFSLAVIAAAAFGGYTLLQTNENESDAASGQDQTPSTAAEPEPETQEASPLTETYESAALDLTLKYPFDWTVNEVNRGIRLESAPFTYATLDKGEVEGTFKIYIRKGARAVDGQYLGKGFALASSEKISYSQPGTGQREDTFLTAFGLDTPDNFGYFIVQGNFDLKKGDTLGPDYAKEISAYLVFGGYGAKDRKDDLATNKLDVGQYSQTPQYKTAVEIVKSLQL